MKSIPSVDDDSNRLIPIEGNVPSPENFPKGCRFAPRCPHAFDRCLQEVPSLMKVDDQRSVRCFLYDKEEVEA